MLMLLLIEACSDCNSNNSGGVNMILAVPLGIAVIVLVISIVINVFFVVQHRQSKYVVISIQSM